MVPQPWTAVATIIAMMLALVACTVGLTQYQLESAIHEIVPCGDEEMERKILAIMHLALDQALKTHIERTFDVMMRNYAGGGNEDQIRDNASRGVRGGINGYLQGEKALAEWKLMRCANRP